MNVLREHGEIRRESGGFMVRRKGCVDVAGLPGVVCENPRRKDPRERVYAKYFCRKPIYLAGQYKRAVAEHLTGKDVFVIGPNGYSDLSEAQCAAWGVRLGAYEAGCHGMLMATSHSILDAFDGIDLRFAHGASAKGIDKVTIAVASELNRPQLGHSCPRFMFYVEDDDVPVFVANTEAEYSNAFIESLHLLIACNGRRQSFEHDIDAAFKRRKHVLPVNILRSISTVGGPPAFGPDGQIEDAVAAFEQLVHLAHRQCYGSADPYRSIVDHVCDTAVSIARPLLSPTLAFSNVRVRRQKQAD